LPVLARGAGDPFEVNVRFCAAPVIPNTLLSASDWPAAPVLLVLARGAGDPFKVDTRFCATPVIPVALLSVDLGSDPWIPRLSNLNAVVVAHEGGTDAAGAKGIVAVLLSGVVDGSAALYASFWSTSLYKLSLMKELALLGKVDISCTGGPRKPLWVVIIYWFSVEIMLYGANLPV
jgi:hypothetical protein